MANSTDQEHTLSSNKEVNTIIPPYIRGFTACVVWLLTTARKVRLAGLIFLLVILLVNYYFIMFDQQNYFVLLEFFAPDGNVTDINAAFFRIWTTIIYLCIAWILATNKPLIALIIELSKTTKQPSLHWRQRKSPYVIAWAAWILISYLPCLFFDYKIIKMLVKEDSFIEYSGFLWLFLTSISFFYLFFRKNRTQETPGLKPRRNIFFLLLGLLFFFGAGEEISWGQRIFHLQTPEALSSNLQGEFNLHNMPLFDARISSYKTKDGRRINVHKTGLAYQLTASYLFGYFWFSFCVLIPLIYITSIRIHKWLDKHDFPIVPAWIGLLFIINHLIYYRVMRPIVDGTITEIREAAYCFLFLILALWFINRPSQRHGHEQKSSLND
jgi:preprotein translocase subunit YajC